jgi:hypothetical protein
MSDRRFPENVPSKDLVPVKSNGGSDSKVPAPKRRSFLANFLALTGLFDEQVKTFEELCSAWRERSRPVTFWHEAESVEFLRDIWTRAREGAERCAAELQQVWATIRNVEDLHHPSTEYLMVRIGSMVMKWPDAKMSAPEDYATGLAERLEVEDLSVMVLESVFREIEDTLKKPPAIVELLPFLNRHKKKWDRRLAAIDLDQIQRRGEEIVFACEFNKAIFESAVLAYLDNHGYVEFAAGVRDNELNPWPVSIEAIARTEKLSELVAKMNDIGSRSDPYEEACSIVRYRDHVRHELDLLLKNAQRCVNRDKPFVCQKCGVGYEDDFRRCMVCGDSCIVAYKVWDEQIAHEQETLQAKLLPELRQHQRREKLERPPPQEAQLWYKNERRKRLERERANKAFEARLGEVRREEWGQIYLSKQLEDQIYTAKAIAQMERKQVASSDEFEPEWTAEAIVSFKNVRNMTKEELAALKIKAKQERAELARDKVLREIQDRLAQLPDLEDQILLEDQVREQGEELRELRDRFSELE